MLLERETTITIKTIDLNLAKQVFQIHAVDERGHVVMKKQLAQAKLAAFFANLPPCLVGMEACLSAHFWANKQARFGHDVRLMAPQFVKPYVKCSKTDHADANETLFAADNLQLDLHGYIARGDPMIDASIVSVLHQGMIAEEKSLVQQI